MKQGPEVKRTFIKKGNNIVVKQLVADVELKPKDVCDNLAKIRNNIQKAEEELKKTEDQALKIVKDIAIIKEGTKDLEKHESWALKIQFSKIKNYLGECFEECKESLDKEYVVDKTLNEEQNNLQKYAMLQKKVSANKNIAENITRAVITESLFVNSIVPNPYK